MGWQILRHSLGLLWRNLGMALRLSVGPLVILALLSRAAGAFVLGTGLFDGGTSLLLALVNGLLLSWVAVAWHRFVLREEAVTGPLPPLSGPETLQHMGWSALLALTFLLLAWGLEPALAQIAAPLAGTGLAGDLGAALGPSLALLFATSYLGLRLGLVLPAAALGRPLDIMASWEATQPASRAIAGLALLGLLGLGLTSLVGPVLFGALLVFEPSPRLWAVLALMAAANWITMMLGLSVLTTLYGHLVERRPLTP